MLHKVLVSKRPRKEEIIIAEVHSARKAKTPVRRQEEEGEREAKMTSAKAKMLFGRRQPTARSTKDVNSSAEIIDDTPDNRLQ